MQAYSHAGGYTPHHYLAAGDDYDIGDYLYNTPRQTDRDQRLPQPKQNTNSKDDCHYNTTRQMWWPDQRLPMPKQNMMSMKRSPDEWIPPPKNYHHMDGYGGYIQNTDNFKSRSGNYSAQNPNVWPGKEQHYSVWSNKNGYPVPGEINGGYRAAINEQRPYYYEHTKGTSSVGFQDHHRLRSLGLWDVK